MRLKIAILATAHAHRKNFDHALRLVDIDKIETYQEKVSDKIFVTRSKKWGRTLSNLKEIEDIAIENGFKMLDCDLLSLKEQIYYFQHARYCIGIHGAALTNIIHCKNKLCLLEILPDFRVNPVYYLMSKHYNYSYACLLGNKCTDESNYFIDPTKFRQRILEFNQEKVL